MLARIKQLPTQAAVAELFYQNEIGDTALALASFYKAPVEVLESLIFLGKLDAKKRNILDIADDDLDLPLHHITEDHPDPAAIKLLVSHHPSALLAEDNSGDIPLDDAIESNENPAVVDIMRELTAARRETIALRTSLLLCIKHGYVIDQRDERQREMAPETGLTFDIQLTFTTLNDNVWSHIMTFL